MANEITETLLTGDTATQVTAAAKAAVPDATVDRVEDDAEGAAYEAHMTKSDGTHVTVKITADFSVSGIETGMKEPTVAPSPASSTDLYPEARRWGG